MSMEFKVLPFPIKIGQVEIFTRAAPGSSLVNYKCLSHRLRLCECHSKKSVSQLNLKQIAKKIFLTLPEAATSGWTKSTDSASSNALKPWVKYSHSPPAMGILVFLYIFKYGNLARPVKKGKVIWTTRISQCTALVWMCALCGGHFQE